MGPGLDLYLKKQMIQTKIMPKVSLFNSKPKVLFVKDSVSHVTSARKLELASNCRVKSATAHTSKFDRHSKVPEKNFKDVVQYELSNLGRHPIEHLILSAPTDDITNLEDAHLSLDDEIEPLKMAVRKSSENMIKTAEKSLERNSSLKTVVLNGPSSKIRCCYS